MKTKDLVELVKQGATPIIRIYDKGSVLEVPDNGMLGRILSVGSEDIWERGTATIPFRINFKEFEAHNKTVAIPNWYDKSGKPTLTWMETDNYEMDSINTEIHEMYVENYEDAELVFIKIVDDNKWLNKYIISNSKLTYTQWLELQLDNALN